MKLKMRMMVTRQKSSTSSLWEYLEMLEPDIKRFGLPAFLWLCTIRVVLVRPFFMPWPSRATISFCWLSNQQLRPITCQVTCCTSSRRRILTWLHRRWISRLHHVEVQRPTSKPAVEESEKLLGLKLLSSLSSSFISPIPGRATVAFYPPPHM